LVPAQKYLASTPTANHYYLIAYSAVFMVVILLMPRGIIPSLRQVADRLSRRTSRTAA
jgi:branched-chain amino acid transport system permease protein